MSTDKTALLSDDPLALWSRFKVKLKTVWLRSTYPFAAFGDRVSIHPSCDIYRRAAPLVSIGSSVFIGPDVWLNLVDIKNATAPKLVLSDGCKLGRRSTISARNRIVLEADVLLAPSVLIMDHNHEFSDPALPIHQQGVTAGGTITIERNCWLGYGAVILSSKGNLTIGRNSVVGANAVVTKSVAPFTIVSGNPAIPVRQYDPVSKNWIRINSSRDPE